MGDAKYNSITPVLNSSSRGINENLTKKNNLLKNGDNLEENYDDEITEENDESIPYTGPTILEELDEIKNNNNEI